MTTERKATSRSPKARRRTNAKTYGARSLVSWLKSYEDAASPVTATSTPSTAPIVAGMTSSRSVTSAWVEASSVPVPASGTETIATVSASFTWTWIGSSIWPVASACLPEVGERGLELR